MRRTIAEMGIVFRKELLDAFRDRRTLLRLLLPNLLLGPIMLIAIASLLASAQGQAQQKSVYLEHLADAPTLVRFLSASGFAVLEAPQDFVAKLHDHSFAHPVLSVPVDFEARLAAGSIAKVTAINDGTNDSSTAALAPLHDLLRSFVHERQRVTLQHAGVDATMLDPMTIGDVDLSTEQARAGRMMSMIPFVLAVALFVGAQSMALDAIAGERERGSLEPLLMNPVSYRALVLGKWGAVCVLSISTCLLSSLSFVVARWFVPSQEFLAAFNFTVFDALTLWLLQIPLAAAVAAGLLAMAVRSRSLKEAQAGSSLAWTTFSLVLMIPFFSGGSVRAWHYWIPGLAQSVQMNSLIQGKALDPHLAMGASLACVGLTVFALTYVIRAIPLSTRA